MGLAQYNRKRNFDVTPEPRGTTAPKRGHTFVVQKHDASHLHYDFRLEHDGVLKSWAIPKGPSFDPSVKRLAMATEDHPLSYGTFEGTIPAGEYGGGTVMLWDHGSWQPIDDAVEGFRKGRLKFELRGEKLRGRWTMIRLRGKGRDKDGEARTWLLFKDKDGTERAASDFDVEAAHPDSVSTGRTLEQIAGGKAAAKKTERTAAPKNAKETVKTAAKKTAKKTATKTARLATPAARAKRTIQAEASVKAAKPTTKVSRSVRPRSSAKAALPDFMPPQLATLASAAPSGAGWVHETKFDGFRILCRIADGAATLFTRTAQDWTTRFPTVAKAAAALPVKNAWLDGEITVLMNDGRTSFGALQNHATLPAGGSLVYFAFDLLFLDGRSLVTLPLVERKEALAQILGRPARGPLRYSEHLDGDGPDVLAKACELGLEGIVSKRADRPHIAGRGLDWLKAKCSRRQEFVIGGFTEPQGARKGIGALLVGVFEEGRLRYAGKVGTGFSQARAAELRTRLDKLKRASSPFSPPARPAPRNPHWVAPKLLAEIAFSEMTSDGKLRHPSFKGLRDDKPATQVVREVPVAPEKTKATAPASATGLTHPDRVLYADCGLTKQDLAAYYQLVSERMLPHLAGRPLAFVRCPGGTASACFFSKHALKGAAAGVRRLNLREKTTSGEYLVVDRADDLRALVQMSALEIHTWGATEANLDAPDRLVFDLDPGPDVKWPAVVEAAHRVRERLQALGLTSFVKSTGGKGLHVVAPLVPAAVWDRARAFCAQLAQALTDEDPARYTVAMPKAGRERKILIDYFRNQRGATVVAPYSTRARAGAPVSVPLDWDELDRVTPAHPVTAKSIASRLATDPWEDYETSRRRLP